MIEQIIETLGAISLFVIVALIAVLIAERVILGAAGED